jgi:formylglycine-generating enzyme required for sulfatase activity
MTILGEVTMFRRCTIVLAVLCSVLSAAGFVSADVFKMPTGQTSLDFVTVGNLGNAADPSTGQGAVPYMYQMGKYDVTAGQYCQFLNAVAKTDTYGLYNSGMATAYPTVAITQSGSPGSYSYSVTGSYSQGVNCPMFDVNWADAARFCNWLQNGQPTGPEGAGTTESGAYTLDGAITDAALMAVNRNSGATYAIPNRNEWYKAAYYNPSNANYWLYPTQSNTAPSNVLSATGTNNANYCPLGSECTDPVNCLTPVGAFASSPGAYGTYDMGGDVWQWNEFGNDVARALYGGCWGYDFDNYLESSGGGGGTPTQAWVQFGFRVVSVPEPGSIALLLTGATALLAYAWRWRPAID